VWQGYRSSAGPGTPVGRYRTTAGLEHTAAAEQRPAGTDASVRRQAKELSQTSNLRHTGLLLCASAQNFTLTIYKGQRISHLSYNTIAEFVVLLG